MVNLSDDIVSSITDGSVKFLVVAYKCADERIGESVLISDISRSWPSHLFGSNFSPSFYRKARNSKWVVSNGVSPSSCVVTKKGEDYLKGLGSSVSSSSPQRSGQAPSFINEKRLDELQKITSLEFDFARLIKMCQEINDNAAHENYIATALLVRALLDHVPPLFKMKSFSEVANNYGPKSFRDCMQPLENSSRKIADGYLHTQIRKKESLPNWTQVNFTQNLDMLLAEIVRVS